MSDIDALQGPWEQAAFEIDGSSAPQNVYDTTDILMMVAENRFVVRSSHGRLLLEGVFSLNPDVIPKAIDFIDSIGPDAGKTLRAIYRLERDRFTFVAAGPGTPRPTTFECGPGLTMRTFVRKPLSHKQRGSA